MKLANELEGGWVETKGLIKEKWGQFTNDEIEKMEGKRDKLIGSLMIKYSMTRDKAEEEVSKFWH